LVGFFFKKKSTSHSLIPHYICHNVFYEKYLLLPENSKRHHFAFSKKTKFCISAIIMFFAYQIVFAQKPISPKRYEIDAKRIDLGYTSKDALPRGREFKRLDSNYYVGWMFEGGYKFEHAADYLGYKNAAYDLAKALNLLAYDFKKELCTRTNDITVYLSVMQYHRDWDFVAYALINCYSNTEQYDALWQVLQRCKKIDLQDEQYLETYNSMAWNVHRNRFYNNQKASFLQNNIEENETYANRLLDSNILKIKRDAMLNSKLFSSNYEAEKMPGVWHYKSILYTYQIDIKNGKKYYDKLKETAYFPVNNYATFCAIQAKFGEARNYYDQAKMQDLGDKRLKESYYYLSVLNEYANKNKLGIEELQQVVKANGSTPGFGWYNIALARNFAYDGQIDQAKIYADKATQFKEIHIGTTLGQSHYDFSTMLLGLILKKKEIASIHFQQKRWWLHPTTILKLAKLTVEKYGLQFLIINQFATNPERDRVIYKLFSTESTVSFDEIYELIDGFSTNYFLKRFKSEIVTDQRFEVKRYYKYFTAKLLMKQKKYEEAKSYLESIERELMLDRESEKLLLARTYEALSICSSKLGQHDTSQDYLQDLYEIYPQLIPFSSLAIKMNLVTNASSKDEQNIIADLKNINIQFAEKKESGTPIVTIDFIKKSKTSLIQLMVKQNGRVIVPTQTISFDRKENMTKKLSWLMFDIGTQNKALVAE
jgi:hypothetical protein